ncbi:hypothetical protein Pmar_PMAR006951 [Perkinsus marinus ATCC 50983]|uniref:Uncharacterized protein n=1 Tax=Perkinsus marinus (strain ATCC 50983 / TXsc) TaxID=423536 RepID=C5KJW1_PERM5|nr:hypothetical protein Pmar_PMAR006951 [Perkinsus marinus ATCC 50983]EER15219.1 hypothetical protein Pmar_PMAR006951 [Perkinsus marinus ATCC 50983]|eukprot:XP_002783423.1 hypothetical protein Pmar_PMAR006951 [Perkinsus marinus ATCC 50983]
MTDKGRNHPMFAGSYRVLAVLLPSWRVRLETAAGNTAEEKSIFTEIHRALNTPAIDQAFVAAIRLLVADYLSRHKSDPCTAGADADCSFTWDQWANGLMDAGIDGPGGFIESAVLVMEEDASDLVQAAAPRALDCCVRIIMVHRDRTALHNIDYSGSTSEPQVHLLFQPGHYELLIPIQPERYSILPIIDDATLVPAGVPVQGPPQPSASNEFEGFMQQVLSKYHALWGQSRYLSSVVDQLLPRLDARARPSPYANPADARCELTEMRNVLKNLGEAQRQLSAMPEDPMDDEKPVPPLSVREESDADTQMPKYLSALRKAYESSTPPKGEGVNLKVEDGTEEALMDWPELQNSITPATASAGVFVCGLCDKDGQIVGDEGDGVRTPCGDKVHKECLRQFVEKTIEKNNTPLGQVFLQTNMRVQEVSDDAEMNSEAATADEPEGEEPAEGCVICKKTGKLELTLPCGCHAHKKCLESSVEAFIRGGQAPAEIECPQHTGRRLGVSFLESTVPAALEPVRSVWSGFSARVAAAAAASGSTRQDNGGGSLKCPVCGDSIAVEANDALLKKCLDPGAYYKLHSARASQNNVPKPLREPDTSRPSSDERLTLKQKFERGWRPCPKGCPYLGNYPSSKAVV